MEQIEVIAVSIEELLPLTLLLPELCDRLFGSIDSPVDRREFSSGPVGDRIRGIRSADPKPCEDSPASGQEKVPCVNRPTQGDAHRRWSGADDRQEAPLFLLKSVEIEGRQVEMSVMEIRVDFVGHRLCATLSQGRRDLREARLEDVLGFVDEVLFVVVTVAVDNVDARLLDCAGDADVALFEAG